MAKRIKAAAYLRRSTKDQEASIDDQRTAVEQYAKKHGYRIVREYVDDGISGDDTEKRKAFLEMRDDADTGEFQVVICWDQDRFGRFDSLEAGHWCYPFRQAGVSVVTVNDGPIDWEDFTGRMMYSMKQEAKHQFLRDLSRNVLRGQSEAAKAGSWIGTPPYAYKITGERKQKRLAIEDHAKAKVVQRIFREYIDDRRSMSAIARGLTADGIPTPGGLKHWRFDSVKVILENHAYTGTFVYNKFSSAKYHTYRNGEITKGAARGRNDAAHWIVIPDNHEAIVDQATFDAAQEILAKGKHGRSPYSEDDNPYLLTGLLRCGLCGSVLHGFNNGKFRYYECSKRKHELRLGVSDGCKGSNVREDEVIRELVRYVESRILGPDEVMDGLWEMARRGKLKERDLPESFKRLKRMLVGKDKPKKPSTKQIQRRINTIDGKIAKAKENLVLLDAEFIPRAQDKIHELQEQREELQRELNQQPTEQGINELVLKVLSRLYRLSASEGDDSEQLKVVLKELDHIRIHTSIRGKGNGRRHKFKRGEVHFFAVAPVTGKSNPHIRHGKAVGCRYIMGACYLLQC